jgi:hypothetical protein
MRKIAVLLSLVVSLFVGASSIGTLKADAYFLDPGDNSTNPWVCSVYLGNVYCWRV